MQSKKKSRAVLITSIGISLFAALSMGVSTFAWFTVASNAGIDAGNGATGTINVKAPDDVEIDDDDVKVFMYRGDPSAKTVQNDYTEVDSIEIDDFNPGEIVTFAVSVPSDGGSFVSGSMDLTYQAFSVSNRTIYNTTGASLKVINILSAIRLSTGANGTGAYPTMTQKLSPIARGSELLLSSLTRVGSTSSYYKQNKITNAINKESIGSSTGYFFYTIEFLNIPSTFYIEKDSTGSSNISTKTDPETRYFTGNDNGGSSCYEGLKFSVTKVEIDIA